MKLTLSETSLSSSSGTNVTSVPDDDDEQLLETAVNVSLNCSRTVVNLRRPIFMLDGFRHFLIPSRQVDHNISFHIFSGSSLTTLLSSGAVYVDNNIYFPVTLREEHGMKVFQSVLKRILCLRGRMKKLNRDVEGLHNLHPSSVFLGCLNRAASGGSRHVNTHTLWNEVRSMKQFVG